MSTDAALGTLGPTRRGGSASSGSSEGRRFRVSDGVFPSGVDRPGVVGVETDVCRHTGTSETSPRRFPD